VLKVIHIFAVNSHSSCRDWGWTVPHIVRFDCFEVDLDACMISKRGIRIGLRDQAFQVLALLLERSGQVVTREDLRQRLWREDVFVDFDNSLNIAVARLRAVLGDSAEHPRFIQTIPKRGYRFIGNLYPGASGVGLGRGGKPRLAVLPFLNLSGDPTQEYFSDAMTDEIITHLTILAPEQLAVIARTSAMHYKGSRKDVARISRELGADYIVEGALHRTDEQIAVNVQLIQTSDQVHLFARRYRAELRDIFRMQDTIAQDIGKQIPSIAGKVRGEGATRKVTDNLAAYNEYIKGRYEMWKWTPEGVERAKRHFEAALAQDPNFALACDALANLYGYLGLWGFLPPDEAEPYRWFYGMRAFELDPTLAEPRTHVAYHPQKCHYQDAYSYNWVEAEKDMANARDMNPNSPIVRVRHATVLGVLGKIEQAIAELECALELDPLSLEVRCWLVLELFLGREYERGLEQAQQLVELESEHHLAQMMLGLIYLGAQRFEESEQAFRRAVRLSDELPLMMGWLGLALGMGGHIAEARRLLERLREIANHRFVLPTSFAWLHLGLGDIDEAFTWMERAVYRNDEWVHPLKTYPFLDPLRSDPRFHGLMHKINLEL
jgi:TolB-like protein/DNA-binding winged helix-turn-helix (wHTH) protein/Flp pilus assembly protein TadD